MLPKGGSVCCNQSVRSAKAAANSVPALRRFLLLNFGA